MIKKKRNYKKKKIKDLKKLKANGNKKLNNKQSSTKKC